MTSLRISCPAKEGVYQGAKWLKTQVLCDAVELKALFAAFSPFSIFPLTGLSEGLPISESAFLDEYDAWMVKLQRGELPSEVSLRAFLAAAFTEDLEALWLQEVPGKRYLTKIAKPLLQVQSAWFSYSALDGEFRPMTLGPRSIFWGLQFSYPQVYQEARTGELKETIRGALFEKLRPWVREFTRATPFVVGGRRVNSPIRLGKNCFSWIHHHPQLKAQGIQIYAE